MFTSFEPRAGFRDSSRQGDAEQGRAGEKGDGEADCYRQESSDDQKDDASQADGIREMEQHVGQHQQGDGDDENQQRAQQDNSGTAA